MKAIVLLAALGGCRYFDSAPTHRPDGGVDAYVFVPCRDASVSCVDVGCVPGQIACGYNDLDAGVFRCPEICDCVTTSGQTVHCY